MTAQTMDEQLPEVIAFPSFDRVHAVKWSPAEAKRRGIYGFDSRDIRSRAFNLLRSRLLRLNRDKGFRSFGIVSATPGVGKSFVATNLAAAASRSPSHQTYLVDLDLRRGSVSRNFGYPSDTGIRAFLEGKIASLDDVAFRLTDERLIVVPSDRGQVHSAELLATSRMKAVTAAMVAAPADSLFICDLPPVFANDDAQVVVSQLDTYLLIVENARTTRRHIEEAIDLLDRSRCAGVVLNRFNGGMLANSYGYGYGGGQAYGEYFS